MLIDKIIVLLDLYILDIRVWVFVLKEKNWLATGLDFTFHEVWTLCSHCNFSWPVVLANIVLMCAFPFTGILCTTETVIIGFTPLYTCLSQLFNYFKTKLSKFKSSVLLGTINKGLV